MKALFVMLIGFSDCAFAGEVVTDVVDEEVDNNEREYEESYDEPETVESQKASKEVTFMSHTFCFHLYICRYEVNWRSCKLDHSSL
jgi:hypothetical protein